MLYISLYQNQWYYSYKYISTAEAISNYYSDPKPLVFDLQIDICLLFFRPNDLKMLSSVQHDKMGTSAVVTSPIPGTVPMSTTTPGHLSHWHQPHQLCGICHLSMCHHML